MPKLKRRKGESKSSQYVRSEMHELKRGRLKSGSGKKVKSRKQAIAIGLNEARRAGAKSAKKKTSRKKSSVAAAPRNRGKSANAPNRRKRNKGRS